MTLKRFAVLGALSVMLSCAVAQAVAQETDPRLVTLVYDAAKIVRIHGRPGVQATIAFAEDERIENVAVGDSDKWQITPNKRANLLFARPLDPVATTNMTVVTDKRTYLFDLVASAKDRPVYMLRFTYKDMTPAPPAAAAQVAAPPPVLAAAPQEARPLPEPRPLVEAEPPRSAPAALAPPVLAEAPQPAPALSAIDLVVGAPAEDLPVNPSGLLAEADKPGDPAPVRIERPKRDRQKKSKPAQNSEPAQQLPQTATVTAYASAVGVAPSGEAGALNFAWIRKGKSALLPVRVYDDGRATYLIWVARHSNPEVRVIGAQGEQLSSGITRNESSVVITGVPSQIVLRDGKASATLDNLRQPRRDVSLAGASAAPGAKQ